MHIPTYAGAAVLHDVKPDHQLYFANSIQVHRYVGKHLSILLLNAGS